MEAKNIIFVVLLGIAAYRWYPASEHNILVLVNSATYDPSRISQVKGLKSAFKIERNIDDTLGRDYHWEQKAKVCKFKNFISSQWVLIKGFTSKSSNQVMYESDKRIYICRVNGKLL